MRRQHGRVAVAVLALLACAAWVWAERGDDSNRKSKNGAAAGVIDGARIEIEYGRPSVKDRRIWGGLVPYDRVWRTGADEATTISFDRDVLIEGRALAAGRYGLFTIPDLKSWTWIFNGTPDQWGAFSYSEAEDALRVQATPRAGDHVETLEFRFEGDRVVLHWEKLEVAFTVAADD